jgi:multisubunit Na+/H+ antiporter MnhF subunit
MSGGWLIASLALLPPLGLSVLATGRGSPGERLVAVQLANSMAVFLFIALDFAFSQPSSIDLALTLAWLGFPAGLLFAIFVERWL